LGYMYARATSIFVVMESFLFKETIWPDLNEVRG
jgi:hypothetical protein